MFTPDPIELAWAAGFFDGEGSTIFASQSKAKRPHLFQLNVRVPQCGEFAKEVLERFKAAVGRLGKVYGPYPRGPRKPEYQFVACNFEHTQAVLAMLWKFLSVQKREQAKKALSAFREYQMQLAA